MLGNNVSWKLQGNSRLIVETINFMKKILISGKIVYGTVKIVTLADFKKLKRNFLSNFTKIAEKIHEKSGELYLKMTDKLVNNFLKILEIPAINFRTL